MNKLIKNLHYKKRGLQVGSVTLIITLLFYFIYILNFPIVENFSTHNYWIYIYSWLGIFLLSFIFITWYKVTGQLLTPYTIFIIFLFLFNYGQCLMWALGIHSSAEIGQGPLYPGYPFPKTEDIVNAQVFVLISILMFHLGALGSSFKYKHIPNKMKKDDVHTIKAIYITSIIIGVISIPVTLFDSIQSFNIAKEYGYKALYYGEYASSNSLPAFLAVFKMSFFPCLVGLLIGSRFNSKVRKFVYIIFAIYLLINLFSGDRGSWIYKLVIFVWLFHTCYKPLNFKKLSSYFLIFLLSLYFIYGIVNLRNIGMNNLDLYIISKAFSFENFPLFTAIFEMGGSLKPTIMLLSYGWDIWPYANTYLLALLGMVTNQMIYYFDVPFSLISSWFSQDYLGITYGAGFSIIAESLLNFGPIFAPLFMVLLGYIISSLIFLNKNAKYTKHPLRFFFVASTLHILMFVIRNYFHLPLKEWFYGVVIFCLLIIFIRFLNRRAVSHQ